MMLSPILPFTLFLSAMLYQVQAVKAIEVLALLGAGLRLLVQIWGFQDRGPQLRRARHLKSCINGELGW